MHKTLLPLLILTIGLVYSRPTDEETSTEGRDGRLLPVPDLLSNENSAAITGAALGLGLGVAGSLIVGKLIDDAAKCKPPAITKLLPLPDLIKLNNIVNPDCRQGYSGLGSDLVDNNYRQPYPVHYPSSGYNVVPDTSYNVVPDTSYNVPQEPSYNVVQDPVIIRPISTQLTPGYVTNDNVLTPGGHLSLDNVVTPDNTLSASNNIHHHYYDSSFSQTGYHTPSPDPVTTTTSSYDEHDSYDKYTFVPNSAIQPRTLEDELFSPVPASKLNLKRNTPALFSPVQKSSQDPRNGRDLESRQLFSPVAKKSGLFTETEAVVATPDKENGNEIRSGKALEDDVRSFTQTDPVVASPNEPIKEPRQGRVAFKEDTSFKQTDAVKATPDEPLKTPRQGRVFFKEDARFKQTDAVKTTPDDALIDTNIRNGKALEENKDFSQFFLETDTTKNNDNHEDIFRDGRVLQPDMSMFTDEADNNTKHRDGPTLFVKSLSSSSHDVSALPDSSSSSSSSRPKTFRFGV